MTTISEAKKSETFIATASIANGKVHKVWAQTLLEEAEAEVFVRKGYVEGGRWGNIYKTVTLQVGETLYITPACGQQRGNWSAKGVYANNYKPGDHVNCVKCAAKTDI